MRLGFRHTNVAALAQAGAIAPLLIYRIGQSNAVTASQNASTGIARYGAILEGGARMPGMSIWDHAEGAWQQYEFGVNTGTKGGFDAGAYSVEAEIVYQMRLAGNSRAVYVIKECVSGNGIDPIFTNGNWWPGGVYVGGGSYPQGTRWTDLIAQRNAALADAAAPITPEIVVIQNQGEADLTDPTSGARYSDNLQAHFARIRSELTANGMIIIERVRPGVGGLAYGGAAQFASSYSVREGMQAVTLADVNAALVDADFIFPDNTQVHPAVADQNWVHEMGQRVHAAIAGTYASIYGNIRDAVPAAFSFTDSDGEASQIVASAPVTISGIERRTSMSVNGGEVRVINIDDSVAQDWTANPAPYEKYQRVQVRGTANSTVGGTANVTLTIGGVSDTFTITTIETVDYEPETDAFTAQAAALGGSTIVGAQKDAINAFYVTAKASTWWGKINHLWLRLADVASSALSLKDQTRVLASVAPSNPPYHWDAAYGWIPGGTPGSQSNIAMQMTDNYAGEVAQNDASVLLWYSQLASNTRGDMTSSTGQTFARFINSGAARVLLNNSGNINISGLPATLGMRAIVRDGESSVRIHGPTGTQIASSTTASVAQTATWMGLGNQTGTVSDARFLGAGFGQALSEGELAEMAAAVDALHGAF